MCYNAAERLKVFMSAFFGSLEQYALWKAVAGVVTSAGL